MWQTKDVLRMQFSRLFTHMLHPNEVIHQRLFALDLVANESKCRDLLKLTVHIGGTVSKILGTKQCFLTLCVNISSTHSGTACELKNFTCNTQRTDIHS